MPYNKRKQKCKQSDGDSGSYVLSYTDKKGKKHSACHTSKKNMQGQIAAIEAEAYESELNVIEENLLRELISCFLLEKKKGLWANVHAKRKRGERAAKPGDSDYPDEKSWKSAQEDDALEGKVLDEAEYQGRKVSLNKPTAIRKGEPSHGKKQDKVYVKDGDKVKKVTFGDPNSRIRKSNPKARKNFRSRHNCENPGPKTKARYWSCKEW